jgi:hypothetical protein
MICEYGTFGGMRTGRENISYFILLLLLLLLWLYSPLLALARFSVS